MNQKPDLAELLSESAGSTRRKQEKQEPSETTSGSLPPSRKGTKPVTGYFPKEVRDQIKILAVQNGTTMQNLIAEALNDLFSKYGKPEIAPMDKSQ